MKQTKERTKWTAVALDPPPWHTMLPWQQPHALSQPSPCQRWSYSLTVGMNSDCRLTHKHTLKYINTSIQTYRKDTWYILHSHRHGTCHTSLDFSDWSRRGVCHSSLFVFASLSLRALTDAPACRVCAHEPWRSTLHTLCTSRTAMLVCEGHKGGIKKKK